jgi:hypothetical protein
VSQEEIEAEGGLLNSWLHYLKLLIVLALVILISYMLLEAIMGRLRKYGKHD